MFSYLEIFTVPNKTFPRMSLLLMATLAYDGTTSLLASSIFYDGRMTVKMKKNRN
jgi:hypothetical protein